MGMEPCRIVTVSVTKNGRSHIFNALHSVFYILLWCMRAAVFESINIRIAADGLKVFQRYVLPVGNGYMDMAKYV